MLRAAAFLLALMVVGSASAVDLGTFTLRSGFAEPLQAVVPLENPDGVRLGTIDIEPASPATYERLDIERPEAIEGLTTELRGSGDIVLRTEAAVSQEVVDLVLVVTWPNGRIVRDYVITLEQPVFTEETRRALRRFEPDVLNDPGAPEAPQPESASEPVPEASGPSVPATITVADNDTLWGLARSVRSDPNHTPQQIMLAFQDLNPRAFINGNINRLRADVTLRVPSAQEIESRSVGEALDDVARQNATMASAAPSEQSAEPVAEPTGDVDSPAPAPSEPERDPDGFLEVVTEASDNAEDADTEGAAATEIRRLQNELAIQEEVNDELRRQYEDQQSRLLELEEQVQLLDRLVELQSQSAADLQDLAGQQSGVEDEGTGSQEDTDEQAAPAGQERLSQWWLAARHWLQQPVNAGLVIAALVVALLLALLMRRRQEPDPEPEAGELDIDDSLLEDDDFPPPPEQPEYPERQAASTPPSGRTVPEVIESADMHIAFQNYGEAEQVLREALAHNPSEPALAHKLLDLFAETGERGAFEALADEYTGAPEALEALYRKLADTEVRDAGDPTPAEHQALSEPENEAWEELSDASDAERPSGSASSGPDEDTDLDFSALDDVDDRTLLGDEGDDDSVEENPRSSQDDRELLEALDDLMDDIDQGELQSPERSESRMQSERPPEPGQPGSEPDMDSGAAEDDEPESPGLSVDDLPGDDWDKEFDFLDGEDEMDTKLDLARAYMDMGDHQGAREILQEVLDDGSGAQKSSAEHLLGQLK